MKETLCLIRPQAPEQDQEWLEPGFSEPEESLIPRDTFTQNAAASVKPSVGLERARARLHMGGRWLWLWGHAAWKQSGNAPAPVLCGVQLK